MTTARQSRVTTGEQQVAPAWLPVQGGGVVEQIIEQIRDMRLRNGTWTRNKYATEIGEPACDGGDDPVLVDRQNLVLAKFARHANDGELACARSR